LVERLEKRCGKDCRKNPGGLPGIAVKSCRTLPRIAAKMKKRRKTHQGPQKPLDNLQRKKHLRKRKDAGQKQSVVSPGYLAEIGGVPEFSETLPIPAPDIDLPERPKRGRPTIAHNFLLSYREHWLYYFEECWPEIGWQLLQIRKAGHAEIGEIQAIFERCPTTDNDSNSCGMNFLRDSPQPVSGDELRANRTTANKLRYEIQEAPRQRSELERSCTDSKNALKQVEGQQRENLEAMLNRRLDLLSQFDQRMSDARRDSEKLESIVPGQETYWYCSQLLDYLCGKKRYAVDPCNLANALAGLPDRAWRTSFDHCAKMKRCAFARLPYRAFQVISHIWRRRPKDTKGVPTEWFKTRIRALPRKDDGIRLRFRQGWRDLRLAIEDCWTAQHSEDFMPYVITSAFLRNHLRQKTPEERILDESETLSDNPQQ